MKYRLFVSYISYMMPTIQMALPLKAKCLHARMAITRYGPDIVLLAEATIQFLGKNKRKLWTS